MATKKKIPRKMGKREAALPPPAERGLPAPEHVVKTTDVVSPSGFKYKDIETTETDAYDPPLPEKKKQ